jgi:hypothetical protein
MKRMAVTTAWRQVLPRIHGALQPLDASREMVTAKALLEMEARSRFCLTAFAQTLLPDLLMKICAHLPSAQTLVGVNRIMVQQENVCLEHEMGPLVRCAMMGRALLEHVLGNGGWAPERVKAHYGRDKAVFSAENKEGLPS